MTKKEEQLLMDALWWLARYAAHAFHHPTFSAYDLMDAVNYRFNLCGGGMAGGVSHVERKAVYGFDPVDPMQYADHKGRIPKIMESTMEINRKFDEEHKR